MQATNRLVTAEIMDYRRVLIRLLGRDLLSRNGNRRGYLTDEDRQELEALLERWEPPRRGRPR